MDEQNKASWLEISVTVDPETAESVAEVLARYAENGVVVERGVNFNDEEDEGTPYGPCRVYGYLKVDQKLEGSRQAILEGLWYLGRITSVPEPEFKYIQDQNWMESWKEFFHPILIGKKLLILPSWIKQEQPNRIPIIIEPSMAFGTGTHPTTQLCLEMAEETTQAGMNVIDIGCGSGILAIGALLLGAKFALCVDISEESMENTTENAQRNNVLDKIEQHIGSVAEIHAGDYSIHSAPLIFVNILAPIIIRLFDAGLADLVEVQGTLILSGILAEQEERVRIAAQAKGLSFVCQRQIGDWVSLAYTKH